MEVLGYLQKIVEIFKMKIIKLIKGKWNTLK